VRANMNWSWKWSRSWRNHKYCSWWKGEWWNKWFFGMKKKKLERIGNDKWNQNQMKMKWSEQKWNRMSYSKRKVLCEFHAYH
jgi:hypothetical protein